MGRTVYRALATVAAGLVGAVFLSGSDQPVTAAPTYARWQELPQPPIAARVHALGVAFGHRVLVLGGLRGGEPLRDGATYDVRTGIWRHLRTPIAVTDQDAAAVAAGVVVLRHVTAGKPASWRRYDVRHGAWSRLQEVPGRLSGPSSFGSEIYATSGRRVVVYDVQLDRWTPLPVDPYRPVLVGATVAASRRGTVVTGYVSGRPHRLRADRWDGLRWHRSRAVSTRDVTAAPDGATRVRLGGRTLVVRDGRAWIRLP